MTNSGVKFLVTVIRQWVRGSKQGMNGCVRLVRKDLNVRTWGFGEIMASNVKGE